ncbi:hotdog domain-containing protein [Soonwooa sp.]|uniref:acyl-CoA thioesterase n=1 Tax=Soonwooa sp. TaxID=1938592 RepID=UPI0028A74FB2|nr:hotdog domain-containing protein [Soonwooa sp.]
MKYHTRKWVKPEDLNPNHTLFGGRLLEWIDEEAALYAIIQLENQKTVTKYMSEINFVNSAKQGDIIEIGLMPISFGHTSLTLKCEVRNKMTYQTIITIDKIVMVALGENGKPVAHGKTQIEYVDDRIKNQNNTED